MNNAFTLGKRAFSAAIAGATILWAMGIAAFAVPQTAHAAAAGDRIKSSSLPAVYYYGYDGQRYTFPNLKTYETWYTSFDGVQTVSDSELQSLQLAGNIVYRPGSRWIKIQTDPKTYAVSTGGSIHWIESQDVATDYAGADWNQNIDDVPDVFFVDYSTGASLMSATAFDGMLYMDGGNNYVAWNGEKRMVSAAGMSANMLRSSYFLDGAGIDDSSLGSGADITGFNCDLSDAAQTGCDEVPATGSVTVSASSSTPATATLPQGANSVEVFTFNISAGSEAATVNAVTASMTGIGATTNIANAYLYRGMDRLSEARSVNASTREVSFTGLGLDLAAGESAALTVRVEVSATASAGDQIKFAVKSADKVDASGGTVSGSFPISGNAFSIAEANAGSVTVTKSGTISNPSLGQNDAVIGKFKVTASSEDASVEEVTLKIDSASDHSDFKLWQGSTLLGTGTHIGSKLVRFDLASPVAITDGSNKVLSVSADIGGDATDAVKVYIDNSADLVAIGGDYGFGMTVTINGSGGYDGSSCTSTSGKCSYSTIQGGDVTISTSGPQAGTIAINSQDQVLFDFSITSTQPITVKDLDFIVYGEDSATPDDDPFDDEDDGDSDDKGLINTNSEGNISDIKVVNADTGSVLLGPLELDCVADDTACSATGSSAEGDASQTIDFTQDFNMSAGETLNLSLTADVDNNVTSGTDFGATLDISGLSIEDENGDTLSTSNIVPSGNLVGKAQEALAGSLAVSLASTPGDVTIVDGTSDVDVVAFSLVTGEASDLDVSSITLSVYADDDGSGTFTLGDTADSPPVDVNDFVSSCSLYDLAGNLVDGPKSPESDGKTIVFDDVNWTLAAGSSERLGVNCDFADPSDATGTDYFAFDIADLSEDIIVVDEDSTDVDPTSDEPNGGTSPTNVVTVKTSGSLSIAKHSSTPNPDFLLTGTTDNLVGVWSLTATDEAFNVKTFTVAEKQAQSDGQGTNSNAYANNLKRVTLEYPAADGSRKTKSVTVTGNEARFTSLDMRATVGSQNLVKAFVDVPATDRDSMGNATSNEKVRLEFFTNTGDSDKEFDANGASSGTAKGDSDLSSTTNGSTHVVRETQPTIEIHANTPGGTGKIPQDQEVLRFTVTAAANEDVVLEEILFTHSATDDASSKWNKCAASEAQTDEDDYDFYDRADLGTPLEADSDDWTLLAADADTCDTSADTSAGEVVKYALLDLTTPEVVSAGATNTYSLFFDSSGADSGASPDSIEFGIAQDPVLTAATSWIDSTDDVADASCDAGEATCAADDGSGGALSGNISVGDLVCFDEGTSGCQSTEEVALVAGISGGNITFVRGYLGRASQAIDDDANLLRLPSALVWQDDGTTDATTNPEQQYWGGYLVDSLPIDGDALEF